MKKFTIVGSKAQHETPQDGGGRDVQKEIEAIVSSAPLVLFMKGSPEAPRCGFSMRASQILMSYEVPLKAIDVLLDPLIREGIKQYADWPTIPQAYVSGELIGGSDILFEMHESGELKSLFENLT